MFNDTFDLTTTSHRIPLVFASAVLWCGIHSLLISPRVQERWRQAWGNRRAFIRLVYSLTSLISLVILLWWWRQLPTRMLWDWPGAWQYLRIVGLGVSLYFFWAGSRVYDNGRIMGLRQIADMRRGVPASPTVLSRVGILNRVRHPYYTGGMVFVVFSSPFTDVNLTWRAVFFCYFIVGTYLEERKLLTEFGPVYAEYQKDVPMFWPRLWR